MSDHHAETPSPEGENAADPTQSIPLHVDKYESAWMRISALVLVIFGLSIGVAAFANGFQVPGVYQRIDPTKIYESNSPFADPQIRELAPGRYEAYIRAQIWSFVPNEVHVPAGSTVTFYVTSQDVVHGIKISDTNINMMAIPGQISTLTAKFDEPGTYNYICHEYCGQLHHTMWGRLVVDPPAGEAEQASVQ